MTPMHPQPEARPATLDRAGRRYEPALGVRLKTFLFVLFLATALLGVSGIYLLSVRALEWLRAPEVYTSQFTLWMFVGHIALGVLISVPFLAFGIAHYVTSRNRRNRRAIRLGMWLFGIGIGVVVSGVALIQLSGMPQLPIGSLSRWIVWGIHVGTPVLAVFLYVAHRKAGPKIRWRYGIAWGVAVAGFVPLMGVLHVHDPRQWGQVGPREGAQYFEPSKARTIDGKFIRADVLMMDEYCQRCHEDVYNDHFHSAHRFSSFNNPPYRFSVRETRKVGLQRDGDTRASRWCAGCHDLVPFFSGAFDNPEFDDVNDPTAHAGITCTACHSITHVNSPIGNADYTIEEPQHYPFAGSTHPFLQWVNNQLVKARPDFHKKTFLKPLHRSAEFCSTCHKVSLPVELNHYKEFLRGQNHYDTFLLSGVSGSGARSFYYPPVAKESCAACHMPLEPSADFGSKDFDGSGTAKRHNHLFPAANNGLAHLLTLEPHLQPFREGFAKARQAHADYLRGKAEDGSDQKLRIDLFGLKEGGHTDGRLLAPLRPTLPALKPGATYLIEVVIRTLGVGHPFTQGTVDSNEVWVDFHAKSGQRTIGRSGALQGRDDTGPLDEWAHRVNVLLLDRHGNRINRRNPQDIFTPLYNHQIPPGAAQVVHYRLTVPPDVTDPVELAVRLRYRKFDFEYLSLVYGGDGKVPPLPIVDICSDRVVLPVEGSPAKVPGQTSPIQPAWQRWNDYGIGCLIEGGVGEKKGELRQAEEAFRRLLGKDMPRDAYAHGYLNMARVQIDEGRLDDAVASLQRARACDLPPPWWTLAWFTALVNLENARTSADFDEVVAGLERILDPANQPRQRKFDFTRDYVVINALARALFRRSQLEATEEGRNSFLQRAIDRYEGTLRIDPEDLDAHYGLSQCYQLLGRLPRTAGDASEPATSEAALTALLAEVRSTRASAANRRAAAARLGRTIATLGRDAVTALAPKRPRFEMVLTELRPAHAQEANPELRAALAAVLGLTHREMHAIFKPDELARGRATRAYRDRHPAADHAAEAIVIYPANRPGAPGL